MNFATQKTFPKGSRLVFSYKNKNLNPLFVCYLSSSASTNNNRFLVSKATTTIRTNSDTNQYFILHRTALSSTKTKLLTTIVREFKFPTRSYSSSNDTTNTSTSPFQTEETNNASKNNNNNSDNNNSDNNNNHKNNNSGGGEWKRNGTLEFSVALLILLYVGVDQYTQYQKNKEREALFNEFRDTLQKQQEDTTTSFEDINKNKKALFTCTVQKVPKLFDGPKSLMGVHVNDIVDVLEENVGPDKSYHLCRHTRVSQQKMKTEGKSSDGKIEDETNTLSSIGWFPISCLERK